jgi:hypothetical protein
VELGEAIALRPIHNQRVGVRDIKAGFDDRRGDQHIKASLPEIDHDLLQVSFCHLPVSNGNPGLWNQLSYLLGFFLHIITLSQLY